MRGHVVAVVVEQRGQVGCLQLFGVRHGRDGREQRGCVGHRLTERGGGRGVLRLPGLQHCGVQDAWQLGAHVAHLVHALRQQAALLALQHRPEGAVHPGARLMQVLSRGRRRQQLLYLRQHGAHLLPEHARLRLLRVRPQRAAVRVAHRQRHRLLLHPASGCRGLPEGVQPAQPRRRQRRQPFGDDALRDARPEIAPEVGAHVGVTACNLGRHKLQHLLQRSAHFDHRLPRGTGRLRSALSCTVHLKAAWLDGDGGAAVQNDRPDGGRHQPVGEVLEALVRQPQQLHPLPGRLHATRMRLIRQLHRAGLLTQHHTLLPPGQHALFQCLAGCCHIRVSLRRQLALVWRARQLGLQVEQLARCLREVTRGGERLDVCKALLPARLCAQRREAGLQLRHAGRQLAVLPHRAQQRLLRGTQPTGISGQQLPELQQHALVHRLPAGAYLVQGGVYCGAQLPAPLAQPLQIQLQGGGCKAPLFSVFRQQVPQAVHRQLHPPPARPWPDAQRASSARRAQEGQLRSPHGWALTNEPPPPAGVSRGRTAAGRKTAF
mmetsp:Transcript_27680/g.71830  ORF Transcript_27680/g.71830 Transcript_27680/m.71830 type:complete len:548 (+) Transcript_27680:1129-2772(+)